MLISYAWVENWTIVLFNSGFVHIKWDWLILRRFLDIEFASVYLPFIQCHLRFICRRLLISESFHLSSWPRLLIWLYGGLWVSHCDWLFCVSLSIGNLRSIKILLLIEIHWLGCHVGEMWSLRWCNRASNIRSLIEAPISWCHDSMSASWCLVVKPLIFPKIPYKP